MCGLTKFRTMPPLVVLELAWLSLGLPGRLDGAAAISGHRAMAHVRLARAPRGRRMLRQLNPRGPKHYGSVAAVFFLTGYFNRLPDSTRGAPNRTLVSGSLDGTTKDQSRNRA